MNSQSANLKGKRKKQLPKNPNPLFTKWLTEWKEEAAVKGWKSQYQYAKALKTIKLFPLCLESGKDCKMLQNFGDKICQMLDEKLAEHKQNRDSEIENIDHDSRTASPLKAVGDTRQQKQNSKSTTAATSRVHIISENSDSEKEEAISPKKKKRKSSGARSREYVPAYRSGPYALILTLYRHSRDPDYKGFHTKAELMHAAQPLTDKSFTLPDAGSHYTAWSSMGSLVKRGLVSKTGSPARFSLTTEGCDLGERLENAERGESNLKASSVESVGCHSSQNCRPASPLRSKTFENEISSLTFGESNDILYSQDASQENAVFVISDDDEEKQLNSRSRLKKRPVSSKTLRTHSLSPSPSESSPPISHEEVFQFVEPSNSGTVSSSENQEIVEKIPISVMDFEGFEDEASNDNDDDVNITGVSQSTPPKFRCLPSLSPPNFENFVTSSTTTHLGTKSESVSNFKLMNNPSTKSKDDVIEINDDDSDNDAVNHSGGSVSDNVNQGKNIFSFTKVHRPHFSQSSQSDEEDLPDLDVPLSKRLFDKGNINSQLLSSCFDTNKIPPHSVRTISSSTTSNCRLPSNDNSCDINASSGNSRDNISESFKHFTAITTKNKKAEPIQKPTVKSSITTSVMPMVTESVDNCDLVVETSSDKPPEPLYTLYPGTYEVVMCIDNREFYGSKSNSKTLLPDLMQNGINCDLRLLHIGDILWVAREKGAANEDPSRSGRKELVLNFAVERKRMDDLVSSITGGRLKEQKFRLSHCGISELIILIEEYGSIKNFSISEDRIKQSIVNSQVLDGFKVKRCGSSKEAVKYLSIMTRFIQKYYGNKTLHAAAHDYVNATAPKTTVGDQEYYLMTFDSFNESSVKQKALSVKEMFGKHLIQVPGVSLERACAITKVYPTVSLLMKAYQNCSSEKSREGLLSTIKCGSKDRNLGIAISRMVYMTYKATQALS